MRVCTVTGIYVWMKPRKRELDKGRKKQASRKRRTETDVTLFLVNKLWVSPDTDARCYQGSSGTIPTTSKKNAIVCQVRHHGDNNPPKQSRCLLGTLPGMGAVYVVVRSVPTLAPSWISRLTVVPGATCTLGVIMITYM